MLAEYSFQARTVQVSFKDGGLYVWASRCCTHIQSNLKSTVKMSQSGKGRLSNCNHFWIVFDQKGVMSIGNQSNGLCRCSCLWLSFEHLEIMIEETSYSKYPLHLLIQVKCRYAELSLGVTQLVLELSKVVALYVSHCYKQASGHCAGNNVVMWL